MTDFSKLARRITFVLFVVQSLYSAGNIASATVNPIVGAQLGGSDYWTGVPTAVFLLGAAFSAFLWGRVMDVTGRRNGLLLGLALGMVGNGLIFFAIRSTSVSVLLIGMALTGATNAAVVLGRFAAGEVNPPGKRGGAISMVVWGGTFGAVFGPLMVGPMGNFVKGYGLDQLTGPYLAAFGLFGVLLLVIFLGLRPDPRDLGKQVAEQYPSETPTGEARSFMEIIRQPAALTAVTAMVLGQVVMVAIMVITSQHMNHHQHGLGDIASVIQAHTVGMYAFSIVSGYLSDKWGRGPVIVSGAVMLLLACLTAPLSPDVLPPGSVTFLFGAWMELLLRGRLGFACRSTLPVGTLTHTGNERPDGGACLSNGKFWERHRFCGNELHGHHDLCRCLILDPAPDGSDVDEAESFSGYDLTALPSLA